MRTCILLCDFPGENLRLDPPPLSSLISHSVILDDLRSGSYSPISRLYVSLMSKSSCFVLGSTLRAALVVPVVEWRVEGLGGAAAGGLLLHCIEVPDYRRPTAMIPAILMDALHPPFFVRISACPPFYTALLPLPPPLFSVTQPSQSQSGQAVISPARSPEPASPDSRSRAVAPASCSLLRSSERAPVVPPPQAPRSRRPSCRPSSLWRPTSPVRVRVVARITGG